jgi:pectinesterase
MKMIYKNANKYLMFKYLKIIGFLLFGIVLSYPASAADYHFVVATDGSGDFRTVQEAIDAVPDFRKNETRIFIKNGTYKEKLVLAGSKTNVMFVGENRDKTILTFDDFASKKNRFGEGMGTTGSTSFFVFGDDFRAENITFENSSGPVGQAVAVRVDGDRVTFINCRFLGFQDTLYPHGETSHQYYRNCVIEGTVDFIFGWSTAVFDRCTVVCKNNGYITAPSTNEGTAFGFVFLDCKITGTANEASFYLGRPWRPFGKSAFLRCELGRFIKPEGWHNWDKKDNEKTAFFAEYKNTGAGALSGERVGWSHQLTDEESLPYTPENVLGEWVKKYSCQ